MAAAGGGAPDPGDPARPRRGRRPAPGHADPRLHRRGRRGRAVGRGGRRAARAARSPRPTGPTWPASSPSAATGSRPAPQARPARPGPGPRPTPRPPRPARPRAARPSCGSTTTPEADALELAELRDDGVEVLLARSTAEAMDVLLPAPGRRRRGRRHGPHRGRASYRSHAGLALLRQLHEAEQVPARAGLRGHPPGSRLDRQDALDAGATTVTSYPDRAVRRPAPGPVHPHPPARSRAPPHRPPPAAQPAAHPAPGGRRACSLSMLASCPWERSR